MTSTHNEGTEAMCTWLYVLALIGRDRVLNVKMFHLDDIISFSRSSCVLYFPTNSMGPLLVAKTGIVFSRETHISVENIFFGLGR